MALGSGWGGSTTPGAPSGGLGPSPTDTQTPQWRPDAGAYLTADAYGKWLLGQQTATQQASTNIETGAQKDIIGAQTGAQSTLSAQEAGQGLTAQSQAEKAAMDALRAQLAEAQRSQAYGAGTESSLLNQKAGIQAAAEARRQAWMMGLLDQFGLGNNSFSMDFSSTDQNGVPGNVSQMEDAERSAAFARAKDQAGQIGQSAISGLNEAMAGRGITPQSGITQTPIGNVINQGATQLGEVNRDQAINAAANARQRATERLSAATTRRGQNLGVMSAALSGLGSASY